MVYQGRRSRVGRGKTAGQRPRGLIGPRASCARGTQRENGFRRCSSPRAPGKPNSFRREKRISLVLLEVPELPLAAVSSDLRQRVSPVVKKDRGRVAARRP